MTKTECDDLNNILSTLIAFQDTISEDEWCADSVGDAVESLFDAYKIAKSQAFDDEFI